MHQHVPGLVRQDQPGALAVEIHVEVGHGVDELDAQRVGGFLGAGGRRDSQRRGGDDGGTAGDFHESLLEFVQT